MIIPILATGVGVPLYTAWLTEALPRSGDSREEITKKVKNIAIAVTSTIAFAAMIQLAVIPAIAPKVAVAKVDSLVQVD